MTNSPTADRFRIETATGRYVFTNAAAADALSTSPDGSRLIPYCEGWLLASAAGGFLCRVWLAPNVPADIWRA